MSKKDLNKTQEIDITSLRLLRYDCAQGDHQAKLEISGSYNVRNDFTQAYECDEYENTKQNLSFFQKLLTPLGHHLSTKKEEIVEIELTDIYDLDEGDENIEVIHDLKKWKY